VKGGERIPEGPSRRPEGVNGSLIKFFHKNPGYVPHSKPEQKPLKESNEKLKEEEWDETDTRLAKYGQNNEHTSGLNCQSDIVREFQTLSNRRFLEMRFPPKIHPFLPKLDS
jgi:hypothetical protein